MSEPQSMTITPQQRFWAKVEKTDSCWLWIATKNTDGYGFFRFEGRSTGAHRVSYIWTHGRIPQGLTIDHLCRIPACVNPEHLEAVSLQENLQRGKAGEQARRTHCLRGHPFSGDNLIRRGSKRYCRACKKLSRKPKPHKIRGPHPREWTPELDARLRELYAQFAGHPVFLDDVARTLGRTRMATATRAYSLGITR